MAAPSGGSWTRGGAGRGGSRGRNLLETEESVPAWGHERGDGFVPDDEPDYDLSDDLAPRYVSRERVRHPRFGAGTIVRTSGFGPDLKVVVAFDGEGEKTLVARLARLERDV